METATSSALVTVYWRPGCPWCARLRRGLARAGISAREIDIWEDRDAAATVRRVAGGNETVPTVFVGDLSLVNPSIAAVREALAEAGAPLERPPSTSRRRTSNLARALRRLAGGRTDS